MKGVSFRKIAPGLQLAEYERYDFDLAASLLDRCTHPVVPACSCIRNGGFAGRNFDWHINFKPVTIVRISNACSRFASIGVVGNFDWLAGLGDDMLPMLPVLICDGMNEQGLQVSASMVPAGESDLNPARWQLRTWGLGAAYTHPELSQAHCSYNIMRYVLDNAASVREALDMVEANNWFDPTGLYSSSGHPSSFHWIISDRRESAFLEFIDNRMEYSITDAVREPSLCTLMTNFYHVLYKNDIFPTFAAGYERYDLMKELYDGASDEEGLCKVLESVRMSGKYTRELADDHFFATDYIFDLMYSGTSLTTEELYSGDGKYDPGFVAAVAAGKARYADRSLWGTSGCWENITTYTSVYDILGKRMKLLLSEGMYDRRWYEFKL